MTLNSFIYLYCEEEQDDSSDKKEDNKMIEGLIGTIYFEEKQDDCSEEDEDNERDVELEEIRLFRLGTSDALSRMSVNKGVVGMCAVNVNGTSYLAVSDRYLKTHFLGMLHCRRCAFTCDFRWLSS